MTITDLTILAAWGTMCGVWSVLLWMQHGLRRGGVLIDPEASRDGESCGRVAVLVPARNESGDIAACLATVLAQDIEDLRVIVIDDRSEDDTGRIVETCARSDPRVTLLRVQELPHGWLGKSHALWQGTRQADADWLLFLDADCRLLTPHAVGAAVREAERRRASLLTLWPRQAVGGFWEALLIPLCGAVMALWFGRSNTPSASAFANGQFLLCRREAYEAIGGHRAVRRAVIEDVPLSELMRGAGMTTWAGGGRDLVSVRMYDTLGGVLRGWSRIFVGALRSPIKIALSMAWLMTVSLWPILALPFILRAWWESGGAVPAALVAMTGLCLTHLALVFAVSIRFWGLGRCDRRYLWLYPFSVVGVLVILADAWWTMSVRRRIGWRSTNYRFDRRAMILDTRSAQGSS